MRLLGEYFYRYLFSRPDIQVAEVVYQGESLALQPLDNSDVERISEELGEPPENYSPGDNHVPTIEWLTARRIKGMWYPNKSINESLQILMTPRRRELAEAIILSPMCMSAALEEIPLDCSVQGLKLFKHYFYNVDLLNPADLSEHLKSDHRHRMIASCHPEDDVALTIMKHLYGVQSSDLSAGKIAKMAIGSTGVKILSNSRGESSVDDSLMLSRYMNVVERAQQILLDGGLAAEDILDMLNEIKIERTDPAVITYKELTGHHYVPEGEKNEGSRSGRSLQSGSTKTERALQPKNSSD